MNKAEFDVLN